MKTCSNCGMTHMDDVLICEVCGDVLPAAQKKKSSGTGGRKLLAIACACVAAVGAAVGIILAAGNAGPEAKMVKALEKTGDELLVHVQQQSKLETLTEVGTDLSEKGMFSTEMSLSVAEYTTALALDYDKKDKCMAGVVSYSDQLQEFAVDLEFYADKKEMRLVMPGVVDDVYGFSYKDFEKKYNKSALRSALGLPVMKDSSVELYKDMDFHSMMTAVTGDRWQEFLDSIRVEKFDVRPMEIGDRTEEVTVYTVTWSAASAESLAEAAAVDTVFSYPMQLLTLLPEIEPDCRCFLNEDGCLIGADFVAAGNKYTLLFEGEENIWDSFSLEVLSLYNEKTVYTGGVVSDGENLHFGLYCDGVQLYALDYSNATGSYTFATAEGVVLGGVLVSDDDSVYFTCEGEGVMLTVNTVKLDGEPASLDRKYVNLMDMNLNEWQRLLIEAVNNLGLNTDILS